MRYSLFLREVRERAHPVSETRKFPLGTRGFKYSTGAHTVEQTA